MTRQTKWWGLVPATWEERRFKYIFREREERSTTGEETLLSVSAYTGVSPRSGLIDEGDHLSRAESLEGYKVCYPDDLVMNIMLAWNRGLGFARQHGIVSPAYAVFQLIDGTFPRFLDYLLRSDQAIAYFKAFSSGVIDSRLRLYPDTFGQLACYLPPPTEQAAIADFLDRETSKIDTMVEEQRRLIELLKEKRQAIISHAVTKGLNPNAKMKPSGVEWLGDIPEHWEVVPLKWLVSHVVDCLHTTPTYEGELRYPAVRTADVERGVLLLEQARLVSEEVYVERIQRLKPEAGDILYSREGERFGMAALVPSGVDLCLGQRMMMFRVLPDNSSAFLMWTLNSEPIYQQVLARTAGATAPHANISDVVNFRVPCPSGIEQRDIADHLADQTSQIDALIAEAASATTLLVERRASLISAAVTGKIVVREPRSVPTVDAVNVERVRLLVAAEIVDLLSHRKAFGRVKLQKLLYLAEADVGIVELQGQYLREAAGPLDRILIGEVDAQLQQDKHVTVVQSDGPGSQVVYHVRGKRGAYHDELVTRIGDRVNGLRALLEKLGDLDTRSVEAVTTLYAVWNDALLDGLEPPDSMIVSGVLEDWHPEKSQKFKAEELLTWLGWMRRNKLVPRGSGPRTTTGRLFI